ncbi:MULTISPECIES: TetR/AcrR family transcriptional regulator [Alphaproteobacteria]|uniref:Transcriptional regulator, TetR family n=1 Tax=Sphingopyxis alaskensis (strain DSM 13593 / LMG 18877 / RB2256) TaxID=317655 RepID=Q1GX19_SPHAL|nr:TetR/AcrR family transcriptional regulator [Sphingopyxis alaskensis]ABF51803.1 transcriptional regulator, TetR family [Sphingopyxis alaskensis RB2256]
MARPKSEQKRNAILAATTGLIAEQGLGAPTAEIAKQAGVPHGSVFAYFNTKAELLRTLYVELSAEMTDTVMADMPGDESARDQFRHLWVRWTHWGASNPSKRRAQAILKLSVERRQADDYASPVFKIIERASEHGTLGDGPPLYVIELVDAWVSTTIDFMIGHPKEADEYCERGFNAMWHALN